MQSHQKDLTGEMFGSLRVAGQAGSLPDGTTLWRCICTIEKNGIVCGNEKVCRRTNLIAGYVKTCGKHRPKDLEGQKFGYLVALRRDEDRCTPRRAYWICRCECTNIHQESRECSVRMTNLLDGTTKSCGCLHATSIGIRCRKAPGFSAFQDLYKRYQQNAKAKNRSFELTQEEVREITQKDCHYCGVRPAQIVSHGARVNASRNGQYIHNGIDRLDSSVGYMIHNCVPCCTVCNLMKLDSSYDDFIAKCRAIAARHPLPTGTDILMKEALDAQEISVPV